ncbi:NADPH-dependent ferric siderophore reductase, contains FAD-binding and SIP domains [Saccharopolyspora kobensis]|uniref:NADPH-dependent ferric siderophore reductase, contains FAD-binding and SIP domains n=2 Tax=Saccharopolyspora kobensis TaxID=146035 RepID=A0A1H5T0H0_9PSEU|nr:siderophore-interacting protein [Saccharopolyspora kobensis]SEF56333.1 NADPH-dependent ferric siderophore reductase, contains FAD-binding and SIP domains [Saccharopolyspora kobensis]SFC51784.1 NADPH-dependent ferric siderophore reductase, contains FAD-binding and SIP domains [Saccharopolyspora kobensis]
MTTYLTVTSAELVTPCLRRVWFRSDDLSAFAGSDHTDRYVKLIFPKPGATYPDPIDVRALRGVLPDEQLPDVRTFTALFPDVADGTMAIDFVLHGDEGVAGRWAAKAAPGDRLMVNGPGGAYRPDRAADWHLLVGDETALPAITAALADLEPDAVVRAIVLVDSAAHEPKLDIPARGELTFLHRDEVGADGVLEAAVRELDWLPGRVHAFVHGEAHEVMRRIRPYLFRERGLARDQVSISGYWRRGRTEEGFREWKAELARAEGR